MDLGGYMLGIPELNCYGTGARVRPPRGQGATAVPAGMARTVVQITNQRLSSSQEIQNAQARGPTLAPGDSSFFRRKPHPPALARDNACEPYKIPGAHGG